MNNNEKFGIELANICFKNNVSKIPFVLNDEQYEAFIKRWYELLAK